jgi:hypothetical protein
VFCSLSLSSLFLARIFLCLLSLVLSCSPARTRKSSRYWTTMR